MLKFERKIGKKIDTCEFDNFESAKTFMENLFYKEDEYAKFEVANFVNGKKSLSLKNRDNKILYQLKTI